MSEIKNLKKAAQRIKRAIKNNENIVLFSDADFDGASALIILEETVKTLGGKISLVYFPDRQEEGYGLSEKTIDFFSSFSPGLIILSDCGIANFKEIKKAKKRGFETIVVDHHEPTGEIPQDEIVVDPKQKDDQSDFKDYSACCLCFKLAEAIFDKMPRSLEQSFLELTAISIISDRMSEEDENKVFMEQGFDFLSRTFRPGLRIFLKKILPSQYGMRNVVQKMTAVLQITDIEKGSHLTECYKFLSESDEERAEEMLERLFEASKKRQEAINIFTDKIDEEIKNNKGSFVFEGGDYLPINLSGAVASRLSAKFDKPAFIFGEKNSFVRGSARSGKSFNTVAALQSCEKYLEVFGGHAPASGFSLKKENLADFKNCLGKYFRS